MDRIEIKLPDLKQAMFNLQEAFLTALPTLKISGGQGDSPMNLSLSGLGNFLKSRRSFGVDTKLLDVAKELIRRGDFARAKIIAREAMKQAQIEGKPQGILEAKGLIMAIAIAEGMERRKKGTR